jgi:hypothetical protein
LIQKKEAHKVPNNLIQTYGVPDWLITDNAKNRAAAPFTKTTMWQNLTRIYHIKQTFMEPHSLWQNNAEADIWKAKW